jgi:hypothetical protein
MANLFDPLTEEQKITHQRIISASDDTDEELTID